MQSTINSKEILTIKKQNGSPGRAKFALCTIPIVHAYLLSNVTLYAGFLSVTLIESVDEENAGAYAGILASSFMVGRALTSYHWGVLSDLYGRKTVLISSLLLCSVFSMSFGLSQSFATALFTRFMTGASNGLMGTVKIAVTECSKGDETMEKKSMGMIMSMRGLGLMISPIVGGLLAQPLKYDDMSFGPIDHCFRIFPFLLPNILGTVLCLVSALCIYINVEETLIQARSIRYICFDLYGWVVSSIKATVQQIQVIFCCNTAHTYLPIDDVVNVDDDSNTASISSIWGNKNCREHLIIYFVASFAQFALDMAFPLFCMSEKGGLGLSATGIGEILSAAGVIYVTTQYFIFVCINEKFSLYKAMFIGGVGGFVPVALIPFSMFLKGEYLVFAFLSIVLSSTKIFLSLMSVEIMIAVNRTVDISHRGTMQGFCSLGGSIAKAAGPVFGGALVSFCYHFFLPRLGGIIIFIVLAIIGFLATVSINYLDKDFISNNFMSDDSSVELEV